MVGTMVGRVGVMAGEGECEKWCDGRCDGGEVVCRCEGVG